MLRRRLMDVAIAGYDLGPAACILVFALFTRHRRLVHHGVEFREQVCKWPLSKLSTKERACVRPARRHLHSGRVRRPGCCDSATRRATTTTNAGAGGSRATTFCQHLNARTDGIEQRLQRVQADVERVRLDGLLAVVVAQVVLPQPGNLPVCEHRLTARILEPRRLGILQPLARIHHHIHDVWAEHVRLGA